MRNTALMSLISLVVFQIVSIQNCYGFKFLVLHPVYSGSHVLTVHHISRELVNRGHDVLTIRYKDTHDLKLEDIKSSQDSGGVKDNEDTDESKSRGLFREYLFSLNNTDGSIPYVTVEEEAKFEIPSDLLWSEGTTLSTLFKLPENPWNVLKGLNIALSFDRKEST